MTAGQTGPAAAAAWAAQQSAQPTIDLTETGRGHPQVRASLSVAPIAVGAHALLHVVCALGTILGGVEAVRLLMATAADDQVELITGTGWGRLEDVAAAAGALTAAATMLATFLVIGWAAAAGYNVRALALDPRRWVRGTERIAGRILVVVALATAWRIAPGGPGKGSRGIELGLAVLFSAALVQLAVVVRRFVIGVTAAELQRAEWVARVEAAAVPRPRGRTARA